MSAKPRMACLALLAALLFAPVLHADEDPVIAAVNDAVAQYKNGRFAEAAAGLDRAGQIIRQKREESLARLLPEPLDGWSAERVSTKTLGETMFGGATTAERRYLRGNASITVKYSSDSPMMQSMLMMFSNPLLASSGGKIETINGRTAVVDFTESSGNINLVVGNTLLVTIDGNNINRDNLLAYAGRIDMEKLANLP